MKKKICFLLLVFILLSFTSCGSPKGDSYTSLEEEVVARALLLQESYGKISVDAAYAYSDGESRYLILHYYGIGKESQNLGDTYCIYITDKNGNIEISDPNSDYDDLSVQLMNVVCLTYEETWDKYKVNDLKITYEQYKIFEEGYLPACYGSKDINDKLR